MGWWGQTPEGASFAQDTDMVWGDGPADVMDDALGKIMDDYVKSWGRLPTEAELIAGLRFSMSILDLRKGGSDAESRV